MEKGKISQYRERLDKTLASAELTNEEMLKTLVKNQMLISSQHEKDGFSEDVLEKRTMEVSNFLDMLRSASVNDHEVSKTSEASHGEWKLKQDTEEFRVMYREGPHGTPFHTLLVEGYVDGPIDVCLCISWESSLYKKWWPQSSFPLFKIVTSECLQKVRIGEQVSLVRMKVSWPLSAREALVHYFSFEYFQDDLIVVLLNTISDVKSIDRSTHGFANDSIPEAKDFVRIDVVGGFALQKVTTERSYFRTIANMDMKLDFVPPSLINFLSRQLIGNGFKLYQKAVASVSNSNEDFCRALKDPLYAQIREALYSIKETDEALEGQGLKSEACILPEEHPIKDTHDDTSTMETNVLVDDSANEPSPDIAQQIKRKVFGEIEEEESEESTCPEDDCEGVDKSKIEMPDYKYFVNDEKKVSIRPEVEQALGTLDEVISIVREHGLNGQTRSSSGFLEDHPNLDKHAEKDSNSSSLADGKVSSVDAACTETAKKEAVEMISHDSKNGTGRDIRSAGSDSFVREVNPNRIAPASSPRQDLSIRIDTNHIDSSSSDNGAIEATGIHENSLNGVKGRLSNNQRKHRFCCLGFKFGS